MKKELFVVRNKIGIFGLQRVEQHWMEGGDRSTKFFHSAANSRRKFNAIMNIVVEGELNVDDSSMQGAIVHLCEKLCHENFPSRPFVEGISYSSISLEMPWSLKNIFPRKKSRRPSTTYARRNSQARWFQYCLFWHCWGVFKRKVMGLFTDFHKKGLSEKNLNATFFHQLTA